MAEQQSFEKIWSVVQQIPAGQVATYGQVADLAGLPKRARLAGKALKHLPKDGFNGLQVPWYRVLRSSGQIAFPPGSESFDRQRSALLEEGVAVKGRTIKLRQYQWQPGLHDMLFALTH